MVRSDFHMHSVFSDGKNTQEEMIISAMGMGCEKIGFSEHAYALCDEECCMSRENTPRYKAQTRALAEKYRGKIDVYCGIEQDYFSSLPTDDYDYVIGSVHYIQVSGEYYSVDNTAEIVRAAAKNAFGGDTMAFAEEYYRLCGDLYNKTRCDIVGHFDLVTKFNERCGLIDTACDRYIRAWKDAAKSLMEGCRLFEINTGAISRGYRTSPYPALDICRFIADNGGYFVMSGDGHTAESIACGFERWKREYENAGLKIIDFTPQRSANPAGQDLLNE